MSRLATTVCVFAFSFAATAQEGRFEIVADGRAAAIVISDKAEPTSRLAAKELSEYVFKVSGVRPEIIGASRSGTPRICIGTMDVFPGEVPEEARKALSGCTKFEAGWTGVKDGVLYFVGKEMMGETYAVYRFLEKYLDIRWFKAATADDPGEYVPPRRDVIAVEPFTECREPDFAHRMLIEVASEQGRPATNGVNCVTRNGWQAMPGLWPYSARPGKFDEARRYHEARMNPSLRNNGGGHCLFENAIPKSEFSEHPEYFALVKGKRVKGDMYCMSNPEVRQRAAEVLIASHESCGLKGFAILELADYVSGNCECDSCRALDAGASGGRSMRFFRVMNDIKARVRKVHPGMRFMSYAYQDYRKIPAGVEVDPDDLIFYCTHGRSMVHAINDPAYPENVRQFGEVMEWKAKVKEVGMREYMTCSHINYRCVERQVAKDLKIYHASGLAGLWEEMVYSDSTLVKAYDTPEYRERQESSWRYFYVAGHMLWDVGLDVDELLADVEEKYYGKAYAPMKKYNDLRRKVWDETPGKYGYAGMDERTPMLLGIGDVKDRLFTYLDEAARLAADDKVLSSRIASDRRFLEEYWCKPNAVLRKIADKGLSAPFKTASMWNAARYEDAFQEMRAGVAVDNRFAPAELKSWVAFLCDADNLYIRLTAKEPSPEKMKMSKRKDDPVWNDDGFEIFIFPPTVENAYAHIAVNALGTVYDARCPGNKKDFDYDVKAVGRIEKDRYTIDVTVPAEKLMPIRAGDFWRVCVARRRTIKDSLTPSGDAVWSLHGVRKHRTDWMLALELGSANCVVNGSFENGTKGWGNVELADVERGKALKLNPKDVVSGYFTGPLDRASEVRKFRWTFRAKGNGSLRCVRAAFTDTPDKTAKYGYVRKMHPLSELVKCGPSAEWRNYSGVSETVADARTGIRFIAEGDGEVFVDDVSTVIVK